MIEMKISSKLKSKADLMIKIRDVIDKKQLSQTEVASMAKVSQPRISDLLKGKIDLFTADSLMDIADAIGISLSVEFKDEAKPD